MEIEDLLERKDKELSVEKSSQPKVEAFEVMSKSRIPEIALLGFLAGVLGLLTFLSLPSGSIVFLLLLGCCLAMGSFTALLLYRLQMQFLIKGHELIIKNRGKDDSFSLIGTRVEPAFRFSKAEGDFESIRLVREDDWRKIPLPDRFAKGDLARERFLSALARAGAEVRLPGHLPPKGGIKDRDEVKIAGTEAGLGCIGVMIASIIVPGVFFFASTGLIVGLSRSLLTFAILIPLLVGMAVNAYNSRGRSRTIIFTPDRLTSIQGKETEWEIPREMLQGIVVESRRRPFRGTEVRVTARTQYQRNHVMIDWTLNRLEARPLLLAHARARGIPVEVRKGGEEPGEGGLLP